VLGRLDERCAAGSLANPGQLLEGRQTLQLYKCAITNTTTLLPSYPSWALCPFTNPLLTSKYSHILALGSTVKLRWRRQNYTTLRRLQQRYKPQLKLRCKWEIRRCNGYKQSATRFNLGTTFRSRSQENTDCLENCVARGLTLFV